MIEPAADTDRLREAFYRVFKSRNPFYPSGRDEFPVRVVLYPTHGYYLETDQFEALVNASRDCGSRRFYISTVEAEPESRNWDGHEFGHWACEEPTLEEYLDLELFLENAIYSGDGSWGVLVSHEDHAVLVCQLPFWNAFRKYYPRWRQDLERFTQQWGLVAKERAVDASWLEPFLNHLTVPA